LLHGYYSKQSRCQSRVAPRQPEIILQKQPGQRAPKLAFPFLDRNKEMYNYYMYVIHPDVMYA